MDEKLLVNFHCHTIFSDGQLTPETLAGNLASAGVLYAALTDHDTIDGLPRFQDALKKKGIAFLPGVEITTRFKGREAHLLAYGFDLENGELNATLNSLRQVRNLEIHSVAGSLRKSGNNQPGKIDSQVPANAAPDGYLEIIEAIDLVHRAGGVAFWAHPLYFEPDPERLERLIGELVELGLDGIEAIYAPFSGEEQKRLQFIAGKFGLLVSAGSDFHGKNGLGSHSLGIEMPRADWVHFRDKVFSGSPFTNNSTSTKQFSAYEKTLFRRTGSPHHFLKRPFILRIFLPTLMAIALFLTVFWAYILPSFEETLLDRKREMIRELTNSAWTILDSYYQDEISGTLTREQAQTLAIDRIQALRYGTDLKDYFWIQDMQPKMIMHPYRVDLNGKALDSIADPRGVFIFIEFANLIQSKGEGYIDYVWQWNDDPQRLEPKESFVKGFQPWNWIIGTGLYIDDVEAEIARIEQGLITTSLSISVAIILLLVFVLQQSLGIEKARQEVVDDLQASMDRYHALVEATTEGTLLILGDRCRYANPIFLKLSGYNLLQLEFLELKDLLPEVEGNEAVWRQIKGLIRAQPGINKPVEGLLRQNKGSFVDAILTINPIQIEGEEGFILLCRDIRSKASTLNLEGLAATALTNPIGLFRARATGKCRILDINPAGESLLFSMIDQTSQQLTLADLFKDPDEYQQFYKLLINEVMVNDYRLHYSLSDGEARYLSLSAKIITDDYQLPVYISGFITDVTEKQVEEIKHAALIQRLQSSLLFLHDPISSLGRDLLICPLETSISQLSRRMTISGVTAAVVVSESSGIIGIITDHDLRARVLAEKLDVDLPVHTIMSAPLTKINENALIYEALRLMEEKSVSHLAVSDQSGNIVSLIDNKSLVQFQSYGPVVLSREISAAESPQELADCCSGIPGMVKTLIDNSARTRHVTNMLASICDVTTERLIQLALDELGPPPGRFAFLAMGSQGRREQTLLTDQDNGIVFVADDQNNPDGSSDYYLHLGKKVSQGLELAGYKRCQGGVMADNPFWCRSLNGWISDLEEWVQKSEPEDIMALSIFFDARTVFGDAELLTVLHRHMYAALQDKPEYFHHAAKNALTFKPPFRLVGRFYLSTHSIEHPGEINLKDAMMPIVSFARLYALKNQLVETHTLDRMEALVERNIVLAATGDEISTAYDFLMQFRLQNQLEGILNVQTPTNIIHPTNLGYIQRELLKQSFSQISIIQKKISFEFLGGI